MYYFCRRKLWLDFFDMEDPDIDDIFACERHFSRKQRIEKGIRFDAVPDKKYVYKINIFINYETS